MRTIKILHIINSLDIGGNERFLLQLLEQLPRERFLQEVCVPDRGKDATRDLEQECRRLGTNITIIRTRGNLDLTVLLKLKRLIAEGGYDIVHTHLVYSQVYGRMAAAMAKARCIVSSEQNIYDFKARFPYRWFERQLGSLTGRIIACSNRVREHLIEKVGVNPLKVVVVPNSVDTKVFFPIEKDSPLSRKVEGTRREIGAKPGDVVIGTVGHMSRQKGHEVLMAAIPAVLQKYPQAKFVFVGKDRLRAKLDNEARRLGIEKSVRFAGIRRDMPVVLNCFDVFVLPSLWEGFGTAIIEALACGVPVVASRVGGVPEIIDDGVDGILVPPARPRLLAEGIIRLLDNPSLRRDMILRGLIKASRSFDVTRMAKTMARIYLQAFSRKECPGREVSGGHNATGPITSTIAWRG